jgi:serine kinase of HPr protein (carbohydrate metabolism regulator)
MMDILSWYAAFTQELRLSEVSKMQQEPTLLIVFSTVKNPDHPNFLIQVSFTQQEPIIQTWAPSSKLEIAGHVTI